MQNSIVTLSKTLLIITLNLFLLSACNNQFASSMRKVTYPPDFEYVTQDTLRSDMGKLSQQMLLLDNALIMQTEQGEDASEIQRTKVLSALQNMAEIASKLKAGEAGANHPFMQDYMQNFAAKIDKAKVAASLAQPRYYFAGQVSGGCTNCHKVNR